MKTGNSDAPVAELNGNDAQGDAGMEEALEQALGDEGSDDPGEGDEGDDDGLSDASQDDDPCDDLDALLDA